MYLQTPSAPSRELEISLMTTLFGLARPARQICANLLEPGCSGVKKLELKPEGGLSDVSGLNPLENLTFTLSCNG